MAVRRAIGGWLLAALFVEVPASCVFTTSDIQGDCVSDADCDDGNPCTDETCASDGFCDRAPRDEPPPEGTCPDANPCTKEVCQDGACANAPDNSLIPSDGNDCTEDTCNDGAQIHTHKPDGTTCGLGSITCMGGECKCTSTAECGVNTACVTFECKDKTCFSTAEPKGKLVDEAESDDCKKSQCDGAGKIELAADTEDFPPDPTPHDCKKKGCDASGVVDVEDGTDSPPPDDSICTMEGCNGMTPINYEPTNEGMSCGAAQSCMLNGGEYQTSFAPTCSNGACIGSQPQSCGLYICNGNDCRDNCQLDGHCLPTAYCDGAACKVKLDNGQACSASNQCTSAFCVDGVCCNNDCTGTCQRCNLAAATGTCSNIVSGQDPENECGGAQACNGNGACAKPQGEACNADAECLGGQCEDNICCNVDCSGPCRRCNLGGNVGTCTNVPAGMQSDTCVSSQACDGNNVRKKQQGVSCGSAAECLSGFCPSESGQDVCCDMACTDLCKSCKGSKTGGVDGACAFILNGTDPENECNGGASADNCNGNGACN